MRKYRFQFPLGWQLFRFGISIWCQRPIVKRYIRPPTTEERDGSISVWLSIYDDDV